MLWIFALFGLIVLWKNRKDRTYQFVLFNVAGIVLSVPFIPPIDSGILRVYAATIPYLILLPALGAAYILKPNQHREERTNRVNQTPGYFLIASGILLIFITTAGSALIRLTNTKPITPKLVCPVLTVPFATRIAAGSYILITDGKDDVTYVPEVRRQDFVNSLMKFPHLKLVLPLINLSDGALLANSLNWINGKPLWLVITGNGRKFIDKEIFACGQWNSDLLTHGLGFLYVDPAQVKIQ
jgi:hypothetical protein